MGFKLYPALLLMVFSLILFRIRCEVSENTTSDSSVDNSDDNSFSLEDLEDNNKVGMDLNFNQNCTKHEDCVAKNSICDSTFDTCECDMTSMQMQYKCRTLYCSSGEECMRFPGSTCVIGRCQCISGRKFNGKCIKDTPMGMGVGSGPLPDWAIISIALTLAGTVVAGGSLKKDQIRQYLIRLISLFVQKEGNTSIEDNERNVNNQDIELQPISKH